MKQEKVAQAFMHDLIWLEHIEHFMALCAAVSFILSHFMRRL
jgi:hypothetical protein